MGATTYKLPSGSGLISGTDIETGSEIEKYKGGNLLGWNLYASEKSKIIIYDNIEKAEGINFGPISFNAGESIRDWFGDQGIEFKVALYCDVVEGAVEGIIFADIQ